VADNGETRDPLSIDPDLTDERDMLHQATGGVARHRRWDVALVIGAGGAIGGAARWALNHLWPSVPGGFPWATFVENVTGCLILGALMVYLLDVWRPSRYARPFLGIGVLGGFTTFSAYAADTHALLRQDQGLLALVYLFGTLIVALVASWTGIALARTAAGITPRTR
jgi:CrcB protein